MYTAQSPLMGQNPFQNNAMAIKKFFARPAVLILAITYTLSSILTLYTSYTTSSSLITFSAYASDSEVLTQSGVMGGLVVSAIIYASICFALFFIYARSKSSDPTALPNAGFTVLQVYAVIGIVLLSIIVAILVFAGVVIGFADLGNVELYWNDILDSIPNINDIPGIELFGSGMDAIVKALVIVIFIAATIFAIALTYIIAGFRFLSSAKYNTRNLNLKVKGSTFFGVMTIIFALFYLIGAIPTLMTSSSVLSSSSPFTVVSTALSFIQLILLIVITLPYSGYIKRTAANAVAFVPTAVPVMPVAGAAYPAQYIANPYGSMPAQPGMPAAPATAVPSVAASGNVPAAAPMAQAPVQAQQPIPTAMPEAQAAQTAASFAPSAPVDVPATSAAPVATAAPVDAPAVPATPVAPAAQTAAEPQTVTPAPEVDEAAPAPTFIEQSMDNAWPTEKHCPSCGAVLPPDSSFCGQCGTRL